MTTTGTETATIDDLPQSAWVLAWASLAGQVVTLLERGPADAVSAFLSMPLCALVVAWVSYGVLRARMGRVWFAGILMLLTTLFGLAALVLEPSLSTVVGALMGVVALAALVAYTQSELFSRLRQQRKPTTPPLGGLMAIAIAVGLLGGLTVAPGNDADNPGFQVRIGI